MKAEQIYEKATGDKEPNNQIAYHEWHNRFVAWMKRYVEKEESGKYKQPWG